MAWKKCAERDSFCTVQLNDSVKLNTVLNVKEIFVKWGKNNQPEDWECSNSLLKIAALAVTCLNQFSPIVLCEARYLHRLKAVRVRCLNCRGGGNLMRQCWYSNECWSGLQGSPYLLLFLILCFHRDYSVGNSWGNVQTFYFLAKASMLPQILHVPHLFNNIYWRAPATDLSSYIILVIVSKISTDRLNVN